MSAYFILSINILAILIGTLMGCILRKYISELLQENSMVYFAAISAAIGIQMLNRVNNFSAVVLAFLCSGVIGHILKLDSRVTSLTKQMSARSESRASETFLVAFTLFCLSTSGILGALNLGFAGDPALLTTKAIMDFLSAIFFAAASGWILALISVPLGLILFGFYFLSTIIAPHLTAEMVGDFCACGGMIQLVNAMRIAKLKDPPVIDLTLSLILIFPISYLCSLL